MSLVNEFPSKSIHDGIAIQFEYPITSANGGDFLPSIKQVFLRAVRPTGSGIRITDARLLDEAFEWLKENVRAGHWKAMAEFEKIVVQTKDGVAVMVDGDAVRWAVLFRFLRDEDAVLFVMRFV